MHSGQREQRASPAPASLPTRAMRPEIAIANDLTIKAMCSARSLTEARVGDKAPDPPQIAAAPARVLLSAASRQDRLQGGGKAAGGIRQQDRLRRPADAGGKASSCRGPKRRRRTSRSRR